MNAAHIKQLKKPQKEFPLSIFIAMILTLIIFIAGTVCIAIVTPKSDSILPSITRRSLVTNAEHLGYEVAQRTVKFTELKD